MVNVVCVYKGKIENKNAIQYLLLKKNQEQKKGCRKTFVSRGKEGYYPLHSCKTWTDLQIQNPLIKKGTESLGRKPCSTKGKIHCEDFPVFPHAYLWPITQVTVSEKMGNDKTFWQLSNIGTELKPTARDPKDHDGPIITGVYQILIIFKWNLVKI